MAPVRERIRITDVAPRDGLQNEAGIIATSDKVRLVELLSLSGVDEVEITSFVSPKRVPQLGDAVEVVEGVRALVLGASSPVRSVLVPNEEGFERALAFHNAGMPLKIALFTAASETFSKKNTNATIAETIERFRPIVPRALAAGMDVRMYVSCAIACPFEGPIKPSAVHDVVDQLMELAEGDDWELLELDVADTIGVAKPEEIESLLEEFDEQLREQQMTLHLHDTFGRAAACVETALDMGIASFDGSAGGLGGCPYAGTPERRAPGNISTDLLVRTVQGAGFDTGVDLAALEEASQFAREIVERAREQAGQT